MPKTRNAAKSVLHQSKPSNRLCQPPVCKRSLKSFLSPRSSFAEDYINGAAFLGRHRTPSSPELRGAHPSNPLYQSQPITRAASFNSLKHLPPDKERSLYIGVNTQKLFLSPKSNRSSTTIVTYRPPLREERKTPSMTPFAIIGLGDSDKLPIAIAPTTSADAQPTSAVGSAGGMRRTSSDVTIAGSMNSSDSDTVSLPHISSPPTLRRI